MKYKSSVNNLSSLASNTPPPRHLFPCFILLFEPFWLFQVGHCLLKSLHFIFSYQLCCIILFWCIFDRYYS